MKELTVNIIQELFMKTGVDEKYFPYYETELKRRFKAFREMYPYEEDLDEDEKAENEEGERICIEFANDYIRYYVEQREKGHSHKWAHFYALNHVSTDDDCSTFENLLELFDDKEEIDKDITIYASSINKDPVFVERLKFLIENTNCNYSEKAVEYCRAYHKCIEEGKSEIYAHAYAEAVNDDSNYCGIYASAFEHAKFHGMNHSEARMFSVCCSEAYANDIFLGNKDFFYTFGEEWQKEYFLKLWCQKFEVENHRKMTDWERQEYRKSLEYDIKCMKYLNKI